MNAITLYTSTCRYILQADHENPESWAELYRLLPYLRQALSCCVCANLLSEPWGPTDTICQHQVCRTCIGGKMRLKPSCSWCKDYEKFVENKELRIVLACYKSLCDYVSATPIADNIETASDNGGPNTTVDILQEGIALRDTYQGSDLAKESNFLQYLLPKLYSHLSRNQNVIQGSNASMETANGTPSDSNPEVGTSPRSGPSFQLNQGPGRLFTSNVGLTNGVGLKYMRNPIGSKRARNASLILSLKASGSNDKMKHKHRSLKHKKKKHKSSRRRKQDRDEKRRRRDYHRSRSDDSSSVDRNSDKRLEELSESSKRIKISSGYRSKLLKGGKLMLTFCRCGTNGTNPGTLPCVTQRCPCFAIEKSCANCKCKSCHNPNSKEPEPTPVVNGAGSSSTTNGDGLGKDGGIEIKKEGNVSDSDSFIDVTGTTGATNAS